VCADCWGPKEENARVFRGAPRTEPLFDFDWDFWIPRVGIGLVIALIVVLGRVLT
jgi:hypothetical protein